MGRRKNRFGRLPKYYEKNRQALHKNPPGRPRKRARLDKGTQPETQDISSCTPTLEELKQVTLPSCAWSIQPSSFNHLAVIKVQEQASSAHPMAITHNLTVQLDSTWTLSVHGHIIDSQSVPALSGFPKVLTVNDFSRLLSTIDKLTVCPGHPDKHFVLLAKFRKGKFTSASGEVSAYLDVNTAVQSNGQTFHETVRVSACHILVSGIKCCECVGYRSTLRVMHHRWLKRQVTSPSKVGSTHSHANDRWLNTPQRKAKVSKLKKRVRVAENKVRYLERKIAASTERLGVNVDNTLHRDLETIMSEQTDQVNSQYKEGSFQQLFWKQQLETMSKYPTQRRWHPMLIRWCLHLRMLSTSAYDALRGILTLPCGRTLQDYTRFIKAGVGVQHEVTEQLMKEAKLESLEEWQKFVGIVFDEMKMKEGIVYDKQQCSIVGFVDLGSVNNRLMTFERSVDDPPQVASEMLVFMVRGLFIKLNFPYAQYPTRGVTADHLFPLAWEVVRHLESAGFKVMSLTGDKASPNRKFFLLHQMGGAQSSGVTYKVRNPYSREERYIYFISDVPHLIKTVRNCWSNSFGHSFKRALWINGKHISWEHLRDLYNRKAASGLTLLPRITYEHLNLNSYSRMRVNLAAQVLSKSVADALEYYNDDETTETRRFVLFFDRFFDMLNTRHLEEGIRRRKSDLAPYRTPDDSRLEWLETDFLGYLKEWESSIRARQGFTPAERVKMQLSQETL